jgi:hypothetical protein
MNRKPLFLGAERGPARAVVIVDIPVVEDDFAMFRLEVCDNRPGYLDVGTDGQ